MQKKLKSISFLRDELVTKGEVCDIISNEPLGYITEQEHIKLENFADRLVSKVLKYSGKEK